MFRKVRSKQSQPVRILFWAGGCFVLIQLITNVLLDCYWPQVRSPFLDHSLKQAQACPHSVDVVCLGSSRLGLAFRSDEVEALMRQQTGDPSFAVFNAGFPAEDYSTSAFILKRLLALGMRPSLVVIEITPEMVARRNRWLGAHVLPTPGLDLPGYLADLWNSRNLGRLLMERIYPVYRYRRSLCEELSAALAKTWTSCWPKKKQASQPSGPARESASACENAPAGSTRAPPQPAAGPAQGYAVPPESFVDGDLSLPSGQLTLEGTSKASLWLKDYHIGGSAARALERLLQQCRQQDMAVLLVIPPLYSAHRRLYTPQIEAAFEDYLAGVKRAYHCASVDCRDQLPDHLFLDNHHVFPEGAARFSRQLVQEVLASAWQDCHPALAHLPVRLSEKAN
jgi:hypothetical protein